MAEPPRSTSIMMSLCQRCCKYGLDFVVARESEYYLSLLLTTQVHVTELGGVRGFVAITPKRLCMLQFAREDMHVDLQADLWSQVHISHHVCQCRFRLRKQSTGCSLLLKRH